MSPPKRRDIDPEHIDALLPQTQCGDCGYQGCRPYAEAIANNQETLDKCLPGGTEVLNQLGALLQEDVSAYQQAMQQKQKPKRLAIIREDECIGCTKCIQACPVDAIVGAAKQMHTVITDECTGCGLCVDPCPVDCIDMVKHPDPNYYQQHARQRYHQRQQRLARQKQTNRQQHQQQVIAKTQTPGQQSKQTKKQAIAAAVARAKSKRRSAD